MPGIVSGAIYLFLSRNNTALLLRWESRVEIDVLFWLRLSFFSLQLPVSIFDSASRCFPPFSIPSLLPWRFYHAHPFHDYAPFSAPTFHFDFPEPRCTMSNVRLLDRASVPPPDSLSFSCGFAQFLSPARSAGRRSCSVTSRARCSGLPRSTDYQSRARDHRRKSEIVRDTIVLWNRSRAAG